MKIRSDFVTNSSSSSYGEVVIDNLVLLEILTRYKDMGTFGEDFPFKVGSYDDNNVDNKFLGKDQSIKTLTPAMHWKLQGDFPPHSLDKVLDEIIEVMDWYWYEFIDEDNAEYNNALYSQLKEELKQREYEILKAYKTVKWYSRQVLYSGRFGCWEFKYDQENGEYYHSEQTGCLDF